MASKSVFEVRDNVPPRRPKMHFRSPLPIDVTGRGGNVWSWQKTTLLARFKELRGVCPTFVRRKSFSVSLHRALWGCLHRAINMFPRTGNSFFQLRHVPLFAWRPNPYSGSAIMFLHCAQTLHKPLSTDVTRRGEVQLLLAKLTQLGCVCVPIASVGSAQVVCYLAPERAAGSLCRAINMCPSMENNSFQPRHVHLFAWCPTPYSRSAITFLRDVQKCVLRGPCQSM